MKLIEFISTIFDSNEIIIILVASFVITTATTTSDFEIFPKIESFYPPNGYQPVKGYEPPNYVVKHAHLPFELEQTDNSISNTNVENFKNFNIQPPHMMQTQLINQAETSQNNNRHDGEKYYQVYLSNQQIGLGSSNWRRTPFPHKSKIHLLAI